MDPGDERPVGVVNWVVPAVASRRQLGRVVVVGLAVHDFFAELVGETRQGVAFIGLAQDGADKIVNDDLGVAKVLRNAAGALCFVALLGEPVFDVFAAWIDGVIAGG